MFGGKKGAASIPRRQHVMFEHDRYYFHEGLAWPLALIKFLVGLGLIVIGIITTQEFWFTVIMFFSPHRDKTFQQGAHIFGYIAGSVGVLFLFTLIFETGRHYSNRQARRGHESLGMMKSMPSHGGDFKLLMFQESQNFLPYILFFIDIGTTMGGFIAWLGTPISVKTMDGVTLTGEVLIVALIFSIIVFYIGPTFVIKSFHLMSHGFEERDEKRMVKAKAGFPISVGRGGGGGNKTVSGSASSVPLSVGKIPPAGLPSPKASPGTHIPGMQALQPNTSQQRKAVNLATEDYDDYRL